MLNMKKIILSTFLILFQAYSACLNYSVVGTSINGKRIETEEDFHFNRALTINVIDIKSIKDNAKNDLKFYKENGDINSYLNYATSLIYLGKYDEAKKILLEIENKQPNIYETSSNLGTLYELTGDNKNALIWIEKALKLNTESHHGSEWIHVAILKKKLGLINSENILNLDFGNEEIPKTNLNKEQLQKLVDDLTYQLSERNQFVKPKENIVGRLYFDLGNALAINLDLESAIKAYKLSKEYGYQNAILDKRLVHFQEIVKDNPDSGKQIDTGDREEKIFLTVIAIISLIFILFVFFIIRYIIRKRKINKN